MYCGIWPATPLTPAMLIVLVMLTTALGVMGSAFSSTMERGQMERALYEAGADLRIQHGGWNHPGGIANNLNANSLQSSPPSEKPRMVASQQPLMPSAPRAI